MDYGVYLHNNTLLIYFPYDPELVEICRGLTQRKFHKKGKFWTAPCTLSNLKKLDDTELPYSQAVKQKYEELQNPNQESRVSVYWQNFPELDQSLRNFQKEDIERIKEFGYSALVANDMGLGKGITALALLHMYPELMPAVIVCPATLKFNWEREARKWTDYSIQVLEGRPSSNNQMRVDRAITIINYDILTNNQGMSCTGWGDLLENFQTLVLDEAHYLKNKNALRTKTVRKLVKKHKPYLLPLTGTPVESNPYEIYNTLNMLRPDMFNSEWQFLSDFCNLYHNGFGWKAGGVSNPDELHELLTNYVMIRRKKEDVLTELPPKQKTVMPLSINNEDEYRRAENNFMEWLADKESDKVQGGEKSSKEARDKIRSASRAEVFSQLESLKQLAWQGKQRQAIQWVQDYLDENGKLIVYCTHTDVLNTLLTCLSKYQPVSISGQQNKKDRQNAVDTFQNDENCRVLVGNIHAAGVGLNLTAANAVCFVEFAWKPSDHDQAESRIERIGQEADSIFAYYLIGAGTIDEYLLRVLDKKREISTQVVDGESSEDENISDMLIEEMKGE